MRKLFFTLILTAVLISGCAVQPLSETPEKLEEQERIKQQEEIEKQLKQLTVNQPAAQPAPAANESANIIGPLPEDQVQAMPEQKQISQAVIKTNKGDITVEFYSQESPKTVMNFVNLANQGFYNQTKFHRVIKDFMIQGGDPLSKDDNSKNRWGSGGPGYAFEDEINQRPLVKGSLAMANSGPNTNGSQFFIVAKDATPWLDGKHTNFGYVVEGMEVVELIQALPADAQNRPLEPVIIEGVELK